MPPKSLIRAFNRERRRSRLKPPPHISRPKKFSSETEAALAFIWEQYDYPCAESLHDELAEAIRIFSRDGMWHYSELATQQLWDMSLGSMKVRTVAMAKMKGTLGP